MSDRADATARALRFVPGASIPTPPKFARELCTFDQKPPAEVTVWRVTSDGYVTLHHGAWGILLHEDDIP